MRNRQIKKDVKTGRYFKYQYLKIELNKKIIDYRIKVNTGSKAAPVITNFTAYVSKLKCKKCGGYKRFFDDGFYSDTGAIVCFHCKEVSTYYHDWDITRDRVRIAKLINKKLCLFYNYNKRGFCLK